MIAGPGMLFECHELGQLMIDGYSWVAPRSVGCVDASAGLAAVAFRHVCTSVGSALAFAGLHRFFTALQSFD